MRTNIVIDDELMTKALEISGIKTKRAVVEEALRLLIRLNEQGRSPTCTASCIGKAI